MLEKEDSEQVQRYCSKCGAQVKPGTTFCVSCGERLAKETGDPERAEDQAIVDEPAIKLPNRWRIGLIVVLAGTVPAVLNNSLLILELVDPVNRIPYLFTDFVFHLLPLPLGVLAGLAWPGQHPKGRVLLGLSAGAIELITDWVIVNIFPNIHMLVEDSLAIGGTIALFILGGIFVDLPQQQPQEASQEDLQRKPPSGWRYYSSTPEYRKAVGPVTTGRHRWPPTRRQVLALIITTGIVVVLISASYHSGLPGFGHIFRQGGWIIGIVEALAVVGILIAIGYRYKWAGFNDKTLWNWLQLLIVPIVLAVGGYLFTSTQHSRDKEIEQVKTQDTAVQTYLDGMSKLSPLANDEDRQLAQARTETVLWRLDTPSEPSIHKRLVLGFLKNDNLIDKRNPTISLRQAHLKEADLAGLDLRNASLQDADLRGSLLMETDLRGADLKGAFLNGADLSNAHLQGAELSNADLAPGETKFTVDPSGTAKTNLTGADLLGTCLEGVKLSQVIGLTQQQIDQADGDNATTLPRNLRTPPSWSKSGCKRA